MCPRQLEIQPEHVANVHRAPAPPSPPSALGPKSAEVEKMDDNKDAPYLDNGRRRMTTGGMKNETSEWHDGWDKAGRDDNRWRKMKKAKTLSPP